jgi:hypothetical protein
MLHGLERQATCGFVVTHAEPISQAKPTLFVRRKIGGKKLK